MTLRVLLSERGIEDFKTEGIDGMIHKVGAGVGLETIPARVLGVYQPMSRLVFMQGGALVQCMEGNFPSRGKLVGVLECPA